MSLVEYYQWLKKDWAKAGLMISVFLLIFLFALVYNQDRIIFVFLLQTPLYMFHQAEEYIFPGGFGKFFNVDIFKLKTEDKPVDQNFIFFINIGLIWIALPLFALLAKIDYRLGIWLPYFSLFAGIAHIVLAIKAKKLYNPGLIVSLLINIPAGIFSALFLIEKGLIENFFLNPYILIGLGVNALLPVMGTILYRRHIKADKDQV